MTVRELSTEATPLVMQAARLVELTGHRRDVGIVVLADARGSAVLVTTCAAAPPCLAGPLAAVLEAAADTGGIGVLVAGDDGEVAGLILGELEDRARVAA